MADSTHSTAKTTTEADLSGRPLAGYRLLRRLGRGAMAEVYLAEQVSLNRQVAVKVLRSNLATDASYVERFHQEARAAAQLVHANIVQIYEVGCADGVHFIAQEYVQGMNLAELLARRGSPQLSKALDIIRQVAAALNKAAAHGIVHRDIKPENIMLATSGEVKVADFGLARLYGEVATNLTQIGITMGTPLYMSPEQVEGKPLDPRSDIYSLGVTSYQMLSGETPFRGDTVLSIALQHLNTQPARLENIRPDLPSAVCRIVHKMLAKEQRERYDTPRQLLHALRLMSIELFQEDPGGDFEGWDGQDMVTMVEVRRRATERIAQAMKTSAMPALRRRRRWRFVLPTLLCFVVGATAAWALRERPLIVPVADDDDKIQRHETAESQYIFALMLNTEAAWKSVPEYFPNDEIYVPRALQHLAKLYLLQDYNFKPAMKIFSDFAQMNDAEVQYKAFGLAGEAMVLNREHKYAQSAQKLAQLWPLRGKLDNEGVAWVRLTLQNNRRQLGDPQSLRNWDQWFQETSVPEPSAREPTTGNQLGPS